MPTPPACPSPPNATQLKIPAPPNQQQDNPRDSKQSLIHVERNKKYLIVPPRAVRFCGGTRKGASSHGDVLARVSDLSNGLQT